jgi:hypothetical protein
MTGLMSGEFLQVACDVLNRSDGDALSSLEWDPRPDVSLSSWLSATLALARAQGRTLAVTPALGIAGAHILYPGLSPADLSVTAVFDAHVVNARLEFVGPAGTDLADKVIVDVPRIGVGFVEARFLARRESGPGPFDPKAAVACVCPVSALDVISGSDQNNERQTAAISLARLFMSAEMLGACEHIMASAVVYAQDRIQFGKPIGTFQAVQHLLAGAEVQIRALGSSIEMLAPRISHLHDPATSHHLALLKALAGRTGYHVSQATLQVFGGIGFTEEHEHHLYAKRLLTLDALCGSKDQLAREIGQAARLGALPLAAVP